MDNMRYYVDAGVTIQNLTDIIPKTFEYRVVNDSSKDIRPLVMLRNDKLELLFRTNDDGHLTKIMPLSGETEHIQAVINLLAKLLQVSIIGEDREVTLARLWSVEPTKKKLRR